MEIKIDTDRKNKIKFIGIILVIVSLILIITLSFVLKNTSNTDIKLDNHN